MNDYTQAVTKALSDIELELDPGFGPYPIEHHGVLLGFKVIKPRKCGIVSLNIHPRAFDSSHKRLKDQCREEIIKRVTRFFGGPDPDHKCIEIGPC